MIKVRQQNGTTYPMVFFLAMASDHITGATGLTPTVTLSKNGAAFGAAAGAVTEISAGWYALAGNATDRNTLGSLALHATGTGADPTDSLYTITPYDPFALADGNSRVDVAKVAGTTQTARDLGANLDVAVGTRLAPTTTGRTLDVDASHKAPATLGGTDYAGNTPQTGDAFARIGSAGSGLSFLATATAATAILNAVTNLNNLSSLANLFAPAVMELPDAGTVQYPMTLTVRDVEGNLVDLDSSPALAAVNGAGADRSGNLSAVTHGSLGVYTFTYGVASTAAEEGLRLTATGTVGGLARRADAASAVADYDSITLLASIAASTTATKAVTDALSPRLPASGTLAVAGDPMALTPSERTTLYAGVWANATRTLTSFGTLAADAAAAVWAAGTRTLSAFAFTVSTAANATETAINAVTTRLAAMLNGATPDKYTAAALSNAPGGGGSGGPVGPGADAVTLRFFADAPDNTVPLPDADVWLTGDADGGPVVAGTLQTRSDGRVTFLLDAGVTYRAYCQKDGYQSIDGQPFTAVAD